MIYCSYELLYMFRALIYPSSGTWVYTSSNVRWVVLKDASALHLPADHQHLWHHSPHIRTGIVSSSWWWAYECPKHVEQLIRIINHQVTSSWFFLLHIYRRCKDTRISRIKHVDCIELLQGLCPIRTLRLRSSSYIRDKFPSLITSGFSCTKFGHFEREGSTFLRKVGRNFSICMV
jgi:hypothetical protein